MRSAAFAGRFRLSLGFIAVAGCLAGSGCKDDQPAARRPQLKNLFVVETPGPGVMRETDLLVTVDGGTPTFSPLASFRAVFDEFLLGTNLENLDGGVNPRGDVATLTWVGAPAGAPTIGAFTSYNPAGFELTMRRTSVGVAPRPGLPSGAQIRLRLPREKVVGRNGALPFEGPEEFTLQTAPFEATLNLMPMTPVAPEFQLTVGFSNVPAPTAKDAVTVSAGGMAVMADVQVDMQNPSSLVVTPPGGKWTPGTAYTITVADTATDQFGVKLAAPVTATFNVSSPTIDAGAVDAGSSDASGATDADSPG
jgi:hypothetical protein